MSRSYRTPLVLLLASVVFQVHAQDVVQVAPKSNKILFENEHIRVLESTFAPGGKEGTHTHPASWYYVTKGGTLKVDYADGKTEMWHAKTGESAWLDGEAPHSATNVGKGALQYLLVEVKDAPTKIPGTK